MTRTNQLLVAAWDLHDGKTLRTYRVSESGAAFVERRDVAADDREATNNQLLDAGVRVGYAYYGFIWVIDDVGFALWTKERQLAEGTNDELRIGDETISCAEIECVEVFVDAENLGCRGVRVHLGTRTVVLAEENVSVDSMTYSAMDLDWEIAWAEFLGRDIALWMRKSYADRHGRVTNLPQLQLYVTCCELADQVGSGEMLRELGAMEGSGRVVLRFGVNPLDDHGRFVEQKVFTPSGKSWYGRWLKLGTLSQVVAFLRDVRTPATIMQTARELRGKLVEDDYA